jgi:hypothetical protein
MKKPRYPIKDGGASCFYAASRLRRQCYNPAMLFDGTPKLTFLLVLLVTVFSGCEQTSTLTSNGTEPYSIKLNDTLGIRLGTHYDDFAAAHRSKKSKQPKQDEPICVDDDADEEVFCTISVSFDNQPKVGDVRVVFYTLTFYQKRLINIDYTLAGMAWETLISGLNDKFGNSRKGPLGWTWENSASKVQFTRSTSDFSEAHLSLALSKETHDWLEKSRERQKAETKKSL